MPLVPDWPTAGGALPALLRRVGAATGAVPGRVGDNASERTSLPVPTNPLLPNFCLKPPQNVDLLFIVWPVALRYFVSYQTCILLQLPSFSADERTAVPKAAMYSGDNEQSSQLRADLLRHARVLATPVQKPGRDPFYYHIVGKLEWKKSILVNPLSGKTTTTKNNLDFSETLGGTLGAPELDHSVPRLGDAVWRMPSLGPAECQRIRIFTYFFPPSMIPDPATCLLLQPLLRWHFMAPGKPTPAGTHTQLPVPCS